MNAGKTTAMFVVILCGRCSTTGNGTWATLFGLDFTMWITRRTLQGFLKLQSNGLEDFSKLMMI